MYDSAISGSSEEIARIVSSNNVTLSDEKISKQRYFGCEIIKEGACKLKLSQVVCITGQSLFHHFFSINSFQSYDPFTVSLGCLLLASKIEEESQIIRTIIRTGYQIYNHRKYGNTGQKKKKELEVGSKLYNNWKEEIINIERVILKDVGFSFENIHTTHIHDTIRDHPHRFILFLSRCVQLDKDVTQIAWNYLNDSMYSDLCIRFKPIIIAAAAIFLASLYEGVHLPDGNNNNNNSDNNNIKYGWWEIVDITYNDLLIVANQIMALYTIDLTGDGSDHVNDHVSDHGVVRVTDDNKNDDLEKVSISSNSNSNSNGDGDDSVQDKFVYRCRWLKPLMTVKYLDDS